MCGDSFNDWIHKCVHLLINSSLNSSVHFTNVFIANQNTNNLLTAYLAWPFEIKIYRNKPKIVLCQYHTG